MKTKELIAKLQEVDPLGDTECCINNCAIEYVTLLPAYYDGLLQVITERDGDDTPTKAKLWHSGQKVEIQYYSIGEQVFFNNGKLEIDYSDLHPAEQARLREHYEKRVAEAHTMEYEHERDRFLQHVAKRAGIEQPSGMVNTDHLKLIPKQLRKAATRYFDEHYGAYAPMPVDLCIWQEDERGRKYMKSWHERRNIQYGREIGLEKTGESFVLFPIMNGNGTSK